MVYKARFSIMEPGTFVQQLTDFSVKLPEAEPVSRVGPKFFSKNLVHVKGVEKQISKMYDHSVEKMVEESHKTAFKNAIEALRDTDHYHYAAERLIERYKRKRITTPQHAPILLESTLNYLSAMRTTAFLERLGKMKQKEMRTFFRDQVRAEKDGKTVNENRYKAARHFERFTRLYDLAENYKNFEYELTRYEREISRINNTLKIPGAEHHLVVTDKRAFYSIYPSVYGGDNFHIRDVSLPNGRKAIVVSNIDLMGHASRHRSAVNNARNMIIGVEESATQHVGNNLSSERGIKGFLREHASLMNRLCEDHALLGNLFTAVIDPQKYKVYYVSAGHAPPMLAHPEKQIKANLKTDLMLGVETRLPHQYNVREYDLEPGEVMMLHSDGIHELEAKGKTIEALPQLSRYFRRLVTHRKGTKETAELIYEKAKKLNEGKPLNDEGRLFVLRRLE